MSPRRHKTEKEMQRDALVFSFLIVAIGPLAKDPDKIRGMFDGVSELAKAVQEKEGKHEPAPS